MKSKIALMMLFPLATIVQKERNGECMILHDGNVKDYFTGIVVGRIEENRFNADTESNRVTRILSRWMSQSSAAHNAHAE